MNRVALSLLVLSTACTAPGVGSRPIGAGDREDASTSDGAEGGDTNVATEDGPSNDGPPDAGGCVQNGVWYRPGETVVRDGACDVCTCDITGTFLCTHIPCPKDAGTAADAATDLVGDARADGGDEVACSDPRPLCTYGCPNDVGLPATCSRGSWSCSNGGSPCYCSFPGHCSPPEGHPQPCVESPWPSPVCGALCGNGGRDTCSFRGGPQPSCPEHTVTEECDGPDFGSQSCESRGFAKGLLTCSPACTIDNSTCDDCVSPTAPVVSCGRAPLVPRQLADFQIAASEDEVGLAWVNGVLGESPRISFARLSSSLDPLSSIELQRTSTGGAPSVGLLSMAVATRPAGWIVGLRSEVALDMPEVSFHAIDAEGRDTGRITVERWPDWSDGSYFFNLFLASRPHGGPLMVWQTRTSVRTSLIAEDGRSATSPIGIAIDPQVQLTGAAFVGDAFYLSLWSQTEVDGRVVGRLLAVRVEPDLGATSVVELLPGELAGAATLVAGAPDLRVVYSAYDPRAADTAGVAINWRRVDSAGRAASPPVELVRDPYNRGIYPVGAVARGEDTVVLLNEFGSRAGIARIDAGGRVVTPARDIVLSPGFYVGFAAVRRGDEALLGWLGPLGLGLVRVAP